MSRPPRIPERGDVAPFIVANLLGLALDDFTRLLFELQQRGFPEADQTAGRFCIEAVDRWRRLRHPRLFPELTAAPTAVHADAAFRERLAQIRGRR
jgi:hypothetical protein